MNPNILIPQILSRSDTVLYLWAILGVVGLAVLVAAARPQQHPSLGRLLFFGFAVFALTHLLSLQWLMKQWSGLSQAVQDSPAWNLPANESMRNHIRQAIDAPQPVWVVPFHLVFDALILTGLWWLSRARRL